VLEGYNATVFAYGQTGYEFDIFNSDHSEYFRCGKSFTMQGLNLPGSPQRGVIPRSFEVINYVQKSNPFLLFYIRFIIISIFLKHHQSQPVQNILFVRPILKFTMKQFVIYSVKM